MIALLQRVSHASVRVDAIVTGAIDSGLLVFVGVERHDTRAQAARLLERILGYRIFADADGHMNLSLTDTGGGLLLVPQFTLVADTSKGMRPGFSPAARPEQGEALFAHLVSAARERHAPVVSGVFGAHMEVSLTNEGPATFWLRAAPPVAKAGQSR